jgi:hypothetical protein
MKFCKDCQFFNAGYCTRKLKEPTYYINPVSGERIQIEQDAEYCMTERNAIFFGCGKDAKYFKEKLAKMN